MSTDGAQLIVETGARRDEVALSTFLDPYDAERADRDANAWIKGLRSVEIERRSFRDRFTFRGDSLWWFAELYLHKHGVVRDALRTASALQSLLARERPSAIELLNASPVLATIAPQIARPRGVVVRGAAHARSRGLRERLGIAGRGALYAGLGLATRLRPGRQARERGSSPAVAAFVHSAFWRPSNAGVDTPDQESYIGPVLQAMSALLSPGELALIGVGPRTTFRARRWWHRAAEFGDPHARALPVTPVETFARWHEVQPSLQMWRQRHAVCDALLSAATLREASSIGGCDLWPLIRSDLTGIAWLQFPWSARAMDEAAAVLDRLRPGLVLTYAEAGGWGRALILEARRRGIPSVGLQHGFIYRHWLNYLHEPDEMEPSARNPLDRGFPRPDLTLVYDGYAAAHLVGAGRFPPAAVAVTGSARLDALVESAGRLDAAALAAVRRTVGAGPEDQIVLLAAKFSQIRSVYPAIVAACAAMAGVRLVVKCHPAETPGPYEELSARATNIAVVPAGTDLASLLAISRLMMTVNSTVAIDAMVLGVPALVVDLPNNLSPFVEAGAMAGAATPEEIMPALRRLLYDEEHRTRLALASRDFMAQYGIASDGHAATRSARAVMALRETSSAGGSAPPSTRRVSGATGATGV